MKNRSPFVTRVAFAAAVALLGPTLASAAEQSEQMSREFTLASGGDRKVTIDNVFGSVKVTAGGVGDRVTVEIRQWAKSRRESALAAAFDEVKLEAHQNGGRLELEQDGPFRCNDHGRHRWGNCDWDPDYEISWEWEVVVPADVDLEVSTVNDGDVVVDGVRGRVEASNVNGEVRASGLAEEAEISSVNGDLVAEFVVVPAGGGSFETVNGEIDLVLPPGASAEVGFETMNGEIYSDFEIEAVPQRAVVDDGRDDGDGRRGGGRRSYKLDRDAVVRIGAGGPRFDCETLNGDIVVRSK